MSAVYQAFSLDIIHAFVAEETNPQSHIPKSSVEEWRLLCKREAYLDSDV